MKRQADHQIQTAAPRMRLGFSALLLCAAILLASCGTASVPAPSGPPPSTESGRGADAISDLTPTSVPDGSAPALTATPVPAQTVAAVPAVTAPADTPPAGCTVEENGAFESAVVALVNARRAESGLPSLQVHDRLTAAARAHSADMACNGIFSHTGSDGSAPAGRVSGQGYRWSAVAENLAEGYASPADVVAGWMDSPGHRENILSPDVVEIGVGYVYRASTEFGHFWTAVFAAP